MCGKRVRVSPVEEVIINEDSVSLIIPKVILFLARCSNLINRVLRKNPNTVHRQKLEHAFILEYSVIDNTRDSGSLIPGLSPGTPTILDYGVMVAQKIYNRENCKKSIV
jgi:hypothetical protein